MERGRYVQPDTDESPLLGTMGAAGSVSKSTLDLCVSWENVASVEKTEWPELGSE